MPSTWYFVRRLSAYHPLPQIASGLCWVFFHSWPLFPGLLAKAFFHRRSGRSPAGLDVPAIVVLVLVLALLRAGFVYADSVVGANNGFRARGLLQRNLLARILGRPAARPLPVSVGEAISKPRDDVDSVWGAGWTFDVVGFSVFAVGGLAILLHVNARVTLLVFLPIVAVIMLAHVARTRLQRVREQSRAASARVAGSIGEVFGAVQAIQVAGAEARVVANLRCLGEERRRAMLSDRLHGPALIANTASLGAGLTLSPAPPSRPTLPPFRRALTPRSARAACASPAAGRSTRPAARMFAREAELLVVDDLSGALDVETERRLWQRLFAEPGRTCLVVSHRPAVLWRADQLIVLEEGRVVAEGSPAELLREGGTPAPWLGA